MATSVASRLRSKLDSVLFLNPTALPSSWKTCSTGCSTLFTSTTLNVSSAFCMTCKLGASLRFSGRGIVGIFTTGCSWNSLITPASCALLNFSSDKFLVAFALAFSSIDLRLSTATLLRFIEFTTRSAVPPIMPPIVNSSNKLSPIGNSSL